MSGAGNGACAWAGRVASVPASSRACRLRRKKRDGILGQAVEGTGISREAGRVRSGWQVPAGAAGWIEGRIGRQRPTDRLRTVG